MLRVQRAPLYALALARFYVAIERRVLVEDCECECNLLPRSGTEITGQGNENRDPILWPGSEVDLSCPTNWSKSAKTIGLKAGRVFVDGAKHER
jgi:hypothetical protein